MVKDKWNLMASLHDSTIYYQRNHKLFQLYHLIFRYQLLLCILYYQMCIYRHLQQIIYQVIALARAG